MSCGVSLFGTRNCSSYAAPSQHVVKGFFELLAEAWVNNRVDAAVEVTQPESYLKDGFRGLTRWEDRPWKRGKKLY